MDFPEISYWGVPLKFVGTFYELWLKLDNNKNYFT
jgi:hypothetical protein